LIISKDSMVVGSTSMFCLHSCAVD
jgi:hypothetical protein